MLLERTQRGSAPSHLTPKPDKPITQKDGLRLNGHSPLTTQNLATESNVGLRVG